MRTNILTVCPFDKRDMPSDAVSSQGGREGDIWVVFGHRRVRQRWCSVVALGRIGGWTSSVLLVISICNGF